VLREKFILSIEIFWDACGDHGWALKVGDCSSDLESTVGAW
jgi:hypothetical protein